MSEPQGSKLVRTLLDFDRFEPDDVRAILNTTDVMAQVLERPVKKVPALQGFTVATLFYEDSTRTRLSFERAARAQSADVMTFSKGGSSVSKGESLRDTVATLESLAVDAFVVRHPSPGAAHQVASWTDKAVINAGDGRRAHPTQALLDVATYERAVGVPVEGRKLVIVGDVAHSRVARSNAALWRLLGADVTVCGPPTLMPHHGGLPAGVTVETRLDRALEGAHAVMVLRVQRERMHEARFASLASYAEQYQINSARLEGAHEDVKVLHPGPMNRDIEIDGRLADGPRSLVTQQVAMGLPVRMAVLYHLLVGKGGSA